MLKLSHGTFRNFICNDFNFDSLVIKIKFTINDICLIDILFDQLEIEMGVTYKFIFNIQIFQFNKFMIESFENFYKFIA